MNVRKVVLQRMRQLDFGPYDVAKAVKGKVSSPTVYSFIKHDRAINAKSLGHILDALRLELRAKE